MNQQHSADAVTAVAAVIFAIPMALAGLAFQTFIFAGLLGMFGVIVGG